MYLKQALSDERFEIMKTDIDKVIEEEANYEKGVLNMRIHKCFAIKVKLCFILASLDIKV